MRAFLFFILFYTPLHLSAQSLTTHERLDMLDEAAFAALESSDANTEKKAETLLTTAQEANSPTHQINAYTILGIVNKNKGHYVSAVEYYKEALDVAENSNDQGRISACYNNIGSVYQIQENYGKALTYFKKSLAIEESLNNPLQKSIRLYNLGDVYREMDSLTLALSHFNSSLIIEQKFENHEGIVYALLGIADVYLKLERPSDASIALGEAKAYLSESNIETQILYNIHQGEVHFQQGQMVQALSYISTAKKLSETHDFRIYKIDIYEKEIAIKTALDERELEKKTEATQTGETFNFWLLLLLAGLIPIALFVRKKGKRKRLPSKSPEAEPSNKKPVFELKNTKGKVLIKVEVAQILCFEANDNYVIVHYLSEGSPAKTMERVTLRKIEQQLSEIDGTFLRVHKSFLVNPNYVREIVGKSQAYRLRLEHMETEIPISRKFDISVFS